MKFSLLILLLALVDPSKIGKVNSEKSEAKTAYQRGEFKNAILHYKTLTDSLGIKEDEVMMNLAHSYFQLNDTVNAQSTYLPLINSSNPQFKSIANQQMGVLTNRLGKFEEALNYFKNALKADPLNEEARYNYEMVKKKLEEKKKQEEQQNKDKKDEKDKKDDQKKDQKDNKDNKDNKDQKDKKDEKKQDKDQQNKDQKDQKSKEQQEKEQQQKEQQEKKEQEQKDKDKKDIPPSVSEKLKEMKMSEDKARMVLEAMKNQEVQYLQQNKRKATKPKSKGKPDW
jgi:Ca-activated chloride channel family protein